MLESSRRAGNNCSKGSGSDSLPSESLMPISHRGAGLVPGIREERAGYVHCLRHGQSVPGRLSRRRRERVDHDQSGDVDEIAIVSRDERDAVFEGRSRNEGIPKAHSLQPP